jgi:hypothetical protein
MKKFAFAAALALVLSACATAYQSEGITGGYSDSQVAPDTWRVMYAGNGYTTAETVQTFWLYHAAELTLAKGYDGFRILSAPGLRPGAGTTELPVDVGLVGKPVLVMNIALLRKPITPRPPVVFDAAALEARLAPIVKLGLCEGNVCPHVHSYLMPELSP